jgi:hypothetical protein
MYILDIARAQKHPEERGFGAEIFFLALENYHLKLGPICGPPKILLHT